MSSEPVGYLQGDVQRQVGAMVVLERRMGLGTDVRVVVVEVREGWHKSEIVQSRTLRGEGG